MTYLDSALTYLETELPSTWVENFTNAITDDNINDPQNVLNAEVAILGVLDPVANLFYEEINFSIIAGEYVQDLATARTKLDTIEAYITNLANFDVAGFPNITAVYQEIFTLGFFNPTRKSLFDYRLMLDLVERQLNYEPGTSMIFHMINNEGEQNRVIDSAAHTMSKMFKINVNIAKIDHGISYKQSTFQNLLLSQHHLKKLGVTGNVSELLSLKCGFLLYKLTFRLQQAKTKLDYAIDFNYSSVRLVEIPEYAKFNTIIKGHYDVGINPTEFDKRFRDSQTLLDHNPNALTLDNYHALIKFYKDEAQDIAKLKKLENSYKDFYALKISSAISAFDKKAYDITFCYIENNILSLELDKKQFNLSNWELKLNDYTERAETSSNSNFFPYYKILKEFLGPEIDRQFLAKADRGQEVLQTLIEKYESNLKKLNLNTGISDEIDYLAFQTDYSNSIIEINVGQSQQKFPCFLSSSFVLPLDYVKFREELDVYKSEFIKFKTMYDIQKLLQDDLRDIQSVKNEIEKTDKRHIEILSIFAALVMFVSNEIQIFTKMPNMRDAVAYTLFFAYGLGLFVLMIWFVTRPEGLRRKSFTFMHYFIIGIFTVGFFAGIYYVNRKQMPKSNSALQLEKLNYKIDSLHKQRTIDTLMQKHTK